MRQWSLTIDAETGVGLDGPPDPLGPPVLVPGHDPVMTLQLSDDGGHQFGPEHVASLGPIGQRQRQVRWQQLGTSRDRRCKLTIRDPVKRAIVAASTDIEILAH